MIDRLGVRDMLDPVKFADSLELDQVGFLIIYLKGSTNQKFYPLRVALEERLQGSPIDRGVGNLVARRFYRTAPNGETP